MIRGMFDPDGGFIPKKEKEVWAATAAEAVALAASEKHRSWADDLETGNPLFAEVRNPDGRTAGSTVYRATPVVVYTDE